MDGERPRDGDRPTMAGGGDVNPPLSEPPGRRWSGDAAECGCPEWCQLDHEHE